MNARDQKRERIVVAALMAAAAALRWYGLGWGLPEVFEEATPMRQAWEMWGWGARAFDPNPHFFNYPSLVIYLQLGAQAVLYWILQAAGTIASTVDFRALYATDKTAFVMTARAVTACFGVATAWAAYALGRRVAGRWGGIIAGSLIALNTFHVSNSQTVTVDVPLAFLCAAALLACVRLLERPSRRRHIVAGIVVGLAASAKYTGALAAVSVLTAHLLARRGKNAAAASGSGLIAAGIAAVVAFVATSPFVVIDFRTFLGNFSVEQYHMGAGHFGLDSASSWHAYAAWLAGRALGWPLLVAGIAGLVYFAGVARRPWALVMAAFAVLYGASVASWSMRAERYLLPLVPVLTVFAAAAVVEAVAKLAESRRAVAVVAAGVVLAVPFALAFPAHLERTRPDPRTLARAWVEANVPSGSFIATEAYGPHLFGPYSVWRLDDEIRRRVFSARSARSYYAVQELPMYQVDAERSGVFYDLRLLAMTDVIITSDAVRSRYERDTARYDRQVAFYQNLESVYDLAAEFPSRAPGGFGVRVYRSRTHAKPFSQRPETPAPDPLPEGLPTAPGAQEQFYFFFGINYEAFNKYAAAYQCYESAFRYSIQQSFLLADVVSGMARCLDNMGQRDRAVELLARVIPLATKDEERVRMQRLHDSLSGRR